MTKLGIDYGKGLQLINVLRDRARRSRRTDAITFPAEEVATKPRSRKFSSTGSNAAEEKIAAGIDYCAALTNWRIRFATALPALIGARTIALLRAAEPKCRKNQSPAQGGATDTSLAAFAAASPVALRALFERLRAPPSR